jgi:hypothetical protein
MLNIPEKNFYIRELLSSGDVKREEYSSEASYLYNNV